MSIEQISGLANTVGVVFLLIAALFAFYREWVILGSTHRREIQDAKAERDFWKETALKGLDLASRSTNVADRATYVLLDADATSHDDLVKPTLTATAARHAQRVVVKSRDDGS